MFHSAEPTTMDLLEGWRWLVGGDARLVGWSSAADLFFVDSRGSVCRLDLGSGDVESVAPSGSAFEAELHDPARANEILLLPIVDAFEARHGQLANGKCLGFKTLPVFGGKYTPENRYVVGIGEFAAYSGDVHLQIRDLPDGAQIVLKPAP